MCGFEKPLHKAAFFMESAEIGPKKPDFGKREPLVFAGVVSFPRAPLILWFDYNELAVFSGIPLRIEAQSGAIDPTSRKGVGPGLWWSHEDASLK